MRRILTGFLTMLLVGCATLVATWEPLPELDVESPAVARAAGSCVGFGSTVEFRESIRNPLGEADSSVFTIYDVDPDTKSSEFRDDEGYILE